MNLPKLSSCLTQNCTPLFRNLTNYANKGTITHTQCCQFSSFPSNLAFVHFILYISGLNLRWRWPITGMHFKTNTLSCQMGLVRNPYPILKIWDTFYHILETFLWNTSPIPVASHPHGNVLYKTIFKIEF